MNILLSNIWNHTSKTWWFQDMAPIGIYYPAFLYVATFSTIYTSLDPSNIAWVNEHAIS